MKVCLNHRLLISPRFCLWQPFWAIASIYQFQIFCDRSRICDFKAVCVQRSRHIHIYTKYPKVLIFYYSQSSVSCPFVTSALVGGVLLDNIRDLCKRGSLWTWVLLLEKVVAFLPFPQLWQHWVKNEILVAFWAVGVIGGIGGSVEALACAFGFGRSVLFEAHN